MERPGFYFCLCPDSALIRDHVTELLARTELAQAITKTFWGEEGLGEKFWEALSISGFSDALRVLIVRDAQLLSAETWRKLSATLATPQSAMPIFFLEGAWEKGQPKLPAHLAKIRCLEFAQTKGWMWRLPGLEPRSLPRFVQAEAKRFGLNMDADVREMLCAVLAPDASSVRAALDQLRLAAPDGRIDADMVGQLAEYSPDVVLFDVIRDLQNGNTASVWKAVASSHADAILFPLMGLLTREARLLWQMRAGENVYVPQHVAGLKRDLAARLGAKGISEIFRLMMEAEWAVKSGQRQPDQALEALTADLALLFAGRRVA